MTVSWARVAYAWHGSLDGSEREIEAQYQCGLGLQRRVGHDAEPTTLSQAKQQYISKAALARRSGKGSR